MTSAVGVVGAGAFGRALARTAQRNGHRVLLWTRGPGIDGIESTRDFARVAEATLVFLAVPSMVLGKVAVGLRDHLDGRHQLVHVSRGLSGPELHPLTRVLSRETPARKVGVLAGPLVASDLERNEPSAAIVGSRFPEVIESVRAALASEHLLVYGTSDVVGVEVASALVGIFSFVLGYVAGHGHGPATRALVGARAIVEAARLGVELGADERTFSGLAGVGDLMAAVAGDGRLEVQLGRSIGKGMDVSAAARDAGAYFEGLAIADNVAAFVKRTGIRAPILEAVHSVLKGRIDGEAALWELMKGEGGVE